MKTRTHTRKRTILTASFVALALLPAASADGPVEMEDNPCHSPFWAPHCHTIFYSIERTFWGIDYALHCIQYPSQCGSDGSWGSAALA